MIVDNELKFSSTKSHIDIAGTKDYHIIYYNY